MPKSMHDLIMDLLGDVICLDIWQKVSYNLFSCTTFLSTQLKSTLRTIHIYIYNNVRVRLLIQISK